MQQQTTIRSTKSSRRLGTFALGIAMGVTMLGGVAGLGSVAGAQVSSYADKQVGQDADELPKVLNTVKVTQKLNNMLPLDAQFTDESGKLVHLGDYFGKRPAIVVEVYYECKMLCSEELKGLVGAIDMQHMRPGKDYDIIVVSIDPTENQVQASEAKTRYLKLYGHLETANGWHFLTGTQANIDALCTATGYGYVRVPGPDGKLNQFAHASAIEIATPQGRLSQYYLGVEYSPKDVELGLVEASDNKIGNTVDNILTYCYHYDPTKNHQTLIVARVVQLGGIVTMAGLGGFMFLMFRRDLQLGRDHESDTDIDKKQNG
jgi:protein SCO1/2